MHRKLGSKKLYICSYTMYFVIFALFPLNSFVTKHAGEVVAATWALVVAQYVVYVASYMTWGKSLRPRLYLGLCTDYAALQAVSSSTLATQPRTKRPSG